MKFVLALIGMLLGFSALAPSDPGTQLIVAGVAAVCVIASILLQLKQNAALGSDHCRIHGMKFDAEGCPACRATMEPPRP